MAHKRPKSLTRSLPYKVSAGFPYRYCSPSSRIRFNWEQYKYDRVQNGKKDKQKNENKINEKKKT